MTGQAGTSLVDQLRADYQARQQAAKPKYVEIWPDGRLLSRIGKVDVKASAGALRALAVLQAVGDDAAELERAGATVDDRMLAEILSSSCRGLYVATPEGEEAITGEHGAPLVFGPEFAAVLGHEEVTTGPGAVILAFTSGEPPELDSFGLLTAAMFVVEQINDGDRAAETAVGEASALAR